MLVRVPLRIRVIAAFAAAMAVVLAGMGAFVYLRMASDLDQTIDEGLHARAAAGSIAGAKLDDDDFAQLVDADGRVVDGTAAPLLTAAELARARRGEVKVDREH